MVDVAGEASFTYEWDNGEPGLAYWHQSWTITSLDLTLSGCSEDGYTLNGTAEYTGSQSGEFDQTEEDSSIYDFVLTFVEDSSADIVATHEASGKDYGLDLAWNLDAELTGEIDVASGDADFQSVDVAITWSANDWTCTATWTNPDKEEWDAECSNN